MHRCRVGHVKHAVNIIGYHVSRPNTRYLDVVLGSCNTITLARVARLNTKLCCRVRSVSHEKHEFPSFWCFTIAHES
jgi:hypothetical protein